MTVQTMRSDYEPFDKETFEKITTDLARDLGDGLAEEIKQVVCDTTMSTITAGPASNFQVSTTIPLSNINWGTLTSPTYLDIEWAEALLDREITVEGRHMYVSVQEALNAAEELTRIKVLADEFPAIKEAWDHLNVLVKLHRDGPSTTK